MDKPEFKIWLWANWLSILVGLVLPIIIGWLWALFQTPLVNLTQHTLSSLVLIFAILFCFLAGLLIYFIKRLLRITRFVNDNFYPNETINGTFRSLEEQMNNDLEVSEGFEKAMK